jgi:protein-tyrosine phosphatase
MVHAVRFSFKRAPKRAPDTSVLFVCMGNICRSPTAESVFRAHVERAGLDDRIHIASAGIGDWHVGQPPDERAIAHARSRGYDLSRLRARQVVPDDFLRFDWILAMDARNLRDLKAICPPDYAGHLGLFLGFAPELGVREVPDPYFGSAVGFEKVLELTEQASAALLEHIVASRGMRDPPA